jgi:beta-lactamase class A
MTDVTVRIVDVFADAGATGWLHARPVVADDVANDVDVGAGRSVAMASVYKLPLAVALMRMIDRGELDGAEPATVATRDRTPGPTGISAMLDPVTMSWRDLASLMMTVSDNAAADAILARVGVAKVAEVLDDLGLRDTRISGGTADAYRLLHVDTGAATLADAFATLADDDQSLEPRAYDPLHSSAATARDMTGLLAALWTNTAASVEGCSLIRGMMSRQVRTNRLASGFAFSGVRVAGKTGTMGALRHEVGVVQYPDESPYAVAVFTQSARAAPVQPRIDAAIGIAARLAVDHLRGLDPIGGEAVPNHGG